jgi:hypothetical protein
LQTTAGQNTERAKYPLKRHHEYRGPSTALPCLHIAGQPWSAALVSLVCGYFPQCETLGKLCVLRAVLDMVEAVQ